MAVEVAMAVGELSSAGGGSSFLQSAPIHCYDRNACTRTDQIAC